MERHDSSGAGAAELNQQIRRALSGSNSYRGLSAPQRQELADAMTKVATFLAVSPEPLAGQMAPDLRARIGTGGDGGNPQQPAPPPAAGVPPAAGQPAPSGGGGPTARVGEVARATLSAIDFPSFVGSLIQGTFQAIVDASIQQMEAYAELLKNCASTIDRFMQDNISDGMARDYLADNFSGLLARDSSGGSPRLVVQNRTRGRSEDELPGFFKDLGFTSPGDVDEQSIEEVAVPAARRYLAESRQRTLATMVLMGINRVVVDDGEIQAKLQFHIDASEAMQMRFDQTKTTAGNMSGYAGRSPFGAQSVMVNTASLNAQTDINVRADLTGQVKVKFRSETFPLERFADSAAIQLINSNARVPQPQVAAAPGTQAPAPAQAPAAPQPPPAAAPPVAPAARAPGAQSLETGDPWAPVGS